MLRLRLSLLTAVLFFGLSGSALAVIPSITLDSTNYVYHGITGVDDLTVAPVAGGKISFTVAVGTITSPGGSCTASAATVTCTPTYPSDSVSLYGGDGADKLKVSGSLAAHGVYFYGEGDADELTGNQEYDAFHPGAGGDRIDGGPPEPLPAGTTDRTPGTDYRTDTVDYSDAGVTPVTASLDGAPNDGPAGDNDNIVGGVERIYTADGNDIVDVSGASGDMTVYADKGDDQVIGGPGNDRLSGGDGNDDLKGGAGNDFLSGDEGGPGDGNDHLDGGDGDDEITAERGNDVELGGPGDDVFNNTYAPDYGTDDVSGGDGDDEAWVVRWAADAYGYPTVGGSGGGKALARRASFRGGGGPPPSPDTVNVSLDGVANDGRPGETSNIRADVENVVTGDGNDTVTGSDAANTISTGLGQDSIDPKGGPDDVKAGPGDDLIAIKDGLGDKGNCGLGTDTISADAGVDALLSCENVTSVPLPVTPTPVGPDIVKATAKFSGLPSTIKKKTFAKSGLKFTITTSEPAKVAAELFAGVSAGKTFAFAAAVNDLQIGSSSLKLGSGARKLTLKPSARWKSRTKNRRLRLTVRFTLTDAAGNVSVITKKVRVR